MLSGNHIISFYFVGMQRKHQDLSKTLATDPPNDHF